MAQNTLKTFSVRIISFTFCLTWFNLVFVYIIYVCTVHIYYVYLNTHTCMYTFQKKIVHILIYNKNYMKINIDM